jgi:hypothetical protein
MDVQILGRARQTGILPAIQKQEVDQFDVLVAGAVVIPRPSQAPAFSFLGSEPGDGGSIPQRCPPSELAFLRGFKAGGLDEFREGGF